LKLADAAGEIYSGLRDLTHEGGPGNFLIVSAGDVYIQFAAHPGNPQLVCEAVSNDYLPEKLQLSAVAMEQLKGLGFVAGADGFNNFSRSFDIPTEEQARELSRLTLRILEEIYGVSKNAEVHLELSLE
jgi:hypothetical protein